MNAFHYINMMVVEEKSAESITALDTHRHQKLHEHCIVIDNIHLILLFTNTHTRTHTVTGTIALYLSLCQCTDDLLNSLNPLQLEHFNWWKWMFNNAKEPKHRNGESSVVLLTFDKWNVSKEKCFSSYNLLFGISFFCTKAIFSCFHRMFMTCPYIHLKLELILCASVNNAHKCGWFS